MGDDKNDAILQRLAILEAQSRQNAVDIAALTASFKSDMEVARDTRKTIADALSAMSSKLDAISEEQSQMRGAVKFGKALYAVIGALGAAAVWVASHISFMR